MSQETRLEHRTSRRTALRRWLVAAALLAFGSVASAQDGDREIADCRYGVPPKEEGEGWARVVLPGDDLFRPPLADVKEPRFSAAYQRLRFRSRGLPAERDDETIHAGIAGFGVNFGVFGLRRADACDGAQLNLFGAVLSQFNLDAPSSDLINSDFLVGFPLSLRRGPASLRMRLYHQSSHLGDEFLLNNPEVDRVNLSFEAFDALFSVEHGWFRLYGGGGAILRSEPDLERGLVQGGVELRAQEWSWRIVRNLRAFPLAGGDWKSFAEHDWNVTSSAQAGFELANLGSRHRIRILGVYLSGFLPFGQFFNTEKIESFGIVAHFEL
ncbi:MAG: DUF1207 domain-containing protein [Candidatus Binatia bacterium]